MKKKLLLIFLIALLNETSYGHKSHVHQYLSQQAYFYLVNQVGTIPYLAIHLGINYDGACHNYTGSGNDADPFLSEYPIMVGTWREDNDDPVYGYNIFYPAGAYFPDRSQSHFWQADEGDYAWSSLSVTYLTILYNVSRHNAYEKAEKYVNGSAILNIVHPCILYYDNSFIEASTIDISYNSLIDLYQTGIWYELIKNLATVF